LNTMASPNQKHLSVTQRLFINDDPFPHVFLEGVFADYNGIKDRIYNQISIIDKGVDKHKGRFFSKLDVPEITKSTLIPQLAKPFISNFPSLDYRLFFTRDILGYKLAPHIDAANKLFTVLFYFPNEETEDGPYGTRLYRQLSDSDFELVKTVPFKSNSCLAFAWRPDSWHGVEEITQRIQRDMVCFVLYKPQEALFPNP
jgi:hypothetical protein